MKIPQERNWTQLNSGDVSGILAESENITLDTDGKVRLSKKAFNRFNSVDNDADLDDVFAIVYYGGQYIAISTKNAFKYDFGGSNTSEISLTLDTNNYSDAVVCFERVYISTDDNLDYYDGSLTASNYGLTTSVPHPLAVFDSLPTYKLCVGSGNTVIPLSSAHAAGTILTLPAEYQVTTLAYRNGYLYVGTKNLNGGEAKIFVWNGGGTNANYEIPVGTSRVYSIIPYGATVAVATNDGRILQVSGNATVELASFPVYQTPNAVWDNGTTSTYIGKIANRGMVAVGDTIYLNIDATVDSGLLPSMKEGIWVYDPKRGLYHHSYHSADKSVVEAATAVSNNTLTLSTHNLKDGDLVIVRDAGSLTGITTGVKYYAKVISATEIKLALSHKALYQGKYVTIGGAVTSSSFSYVPNTDYAQSFNVFTGAITAINPEEPFFLGWETPVLWAARMENKDGAAMYALMGLTEAWNIGRITTQRIYSENIKQNWKKLYGFFSNLILDNEQIVVKYKTDGSSSYPTKRMKGAWLSSTQINSIGNDDEEQWSDIEEGDELTIVDGYGRGYTTHVVSIDTSSNTKTIVVDEAVGTANENVYFVADSFRKISTITRELNDTGIFEASLGNVASPWVQLKLEMRGFQIEIDMLDLANAVNQSSD